jgi:pimeloyl-ACP methyl ester carboxylesterase
MQPAPPQIVTRSSCQRDVSTMARCAHCDVHHHPARVRHKPRLVPEAHLRAARGWVERVWADEIDDRFPEAEQAHGSDRNRLSSRAGMGPVSEHRDEIGGLSVFWRTAPGPDPPTLFVHGVPNASEMWEPFLTRAGGIAVDLPGFGRSAKRGDFDYSMPGYDRFLERFLDHVGIDRLNLAAHDWGAGVGLSFAQRCPERLARLVIINGVPLLPGYRWHRLARAWRTRGVGELVMGLTGRWSLRLLSREASPRPGPMPEEFLDEILAHFDPGTQRAILRLYRSSPPAVLERAGEHLGALHCPALVVWGDCDPYIPPSFADGYGQALPEARVLHLPDAGHWPWLDDPALVARIVAFLGTA